MGALDYLSNFCTVDSSSTRSRRRAMQVNCSPCIIIIHSLYPQVNHCYCCPFYQITICVSYRQMCSLLSNILFSLTKTLESPTFLLMIWSVSPLSSFRQLRSRLRWTVMAVREELKVLSTPLEVLSFSVPSLLPSLCPQLSSSIFPSRRDALFPLTEKWTIEREWWMMILLIKHL